MWSTFANARAALSQPRLLLGEIARRYYRRGSTLADREWVRRTFRLWCSGAEQVVWTRRGFRMRAAPRDYSTHAIFFFGEYDAPMSDAVVHCVREGGAAWDVGAERGWFSLLMGRLVGPRGRVDAFEAFAPNAARLRANIALNDYHWIRVHEVAAGDREGCVQFVPPSDAVTRHRTYLAHCTGVGYVSAEPHPDAIESPSVRLDDVAQRSGLGRLDFIKLDIEGAELAALHGAEQTIRTRRPILAVEYNWEAARRAGAAVEAIDALLHDWRYERFTFDGTFKRLDLAPFRDRPEEEQITNVYAFPAP